MYIHSEYLRSSVTVATADLLSRLRGNRSTFFLPPSLLVVRKIPYRPSGSTQVMLSLLSSLLSAAFLSSATRRRA